MSKAQDPNQNSEFIIFKTVQENWANYNDTLKRIL